MGIFSKLIYSTSHFWIIPYLLREFIKQNLLKKILALALSFPRFATKPASRKNMTSYSQTRRISQLASNSVIHWNPIITYFNSAHINDQYLQTAVGKYIVATFQY